MSSADEKVLCVPDESFKNLFDERTNILAKNYNFKNKNFVSAEIMPLNLIAWLANGGYYRSAIYYPRSECETDKSLRQLCSYVVLNTNGYIVSYTRSKAGGEGRLYGKKSLGFGGHINDTDFVDNKITPDSLLNAAKRDFYEELEFGSLPQDFRFVGSIYVPESDDPVHLVHLGLVWEARSLFTGVKAKEEAISNLQTSVIGDLHTSISEFEYWSQIILDVANAPLYSFF